MNQPIWAIKYVGIPYQKKGRSSFGVDCLGLLILVYRQDLRIQIPDPAAKYTDDSAAEELQELAHEEAEKWWPIPLGEEQPFDAVLMTIRGCDQHIGIVTRPPWMIHTEKGIYTVLERYDRPRWRRRLQGFHRHEELHAEEGRRFARSMIPPRGPK